MVKLKLLDKLKKRLHKDIALVQDLVIEITYDVFPNAVFHGGTAIWRCYEGTRFSEDINLYLDKDELNKIDLFKEKLKQRSLSVNKFKVTDNVIYAKIALNNIEMRFEASFLKFNKNKTIIKPYETIEGNYINIFTISPEELIKEKVNAYISRLFIRDLYDIYILLNYADQNRDTKNALRKLLSEFKDPVNEDILTSLVFIGAVPTTKQMLFAIKKWAR